MQNKIEEVEKRHTAAETHEAREGHTSTRTSAPAWRAHGHHVNRKAGQQSARRGSAHTKVELSASRINKHTHHTSHSTKLHGCVCFGLGFFIL